jgi:hypothetical protein
MSLAAGNKNSSSLDLRVKEEVAIGLVGIRWSWPWPWPSSPMSRALIGSFPGAPPSLCFLIPRMEWKVERRVGRKLQRMGGVYALEKIDGMRICNLF